ncbi:MAG TPA: class I SAM-dependent methyltransferase [Candidatus Sulfotelmatobacter sp.]|nr:class I SAM-dependent methyltransferase [Candidatus Sulfotelmatobacter sp.]
MAVIAPTLAPASSRPVIPERTLLAGVALTSFAALLLELALTRLFSVVLFYHFAFLAISIALLGLGAGGVFAYLLKSRLSKIGTRTLAAYLCGANSIVVVAVLEIVLHVPVALSVSEKNFLRLTALYLAAAVPFFLTGLLFSILFARETRRIPRLYGADLSGGALACLAVVPLLNWFGGPNVILVSGIALAVAAMIWAESRATRRNSGVVALALIALIAANHSGRLIDVVYAKGMFRDPAWVEFARWNALSRVEVDRQGQAKAIVIDADASTYIMNADVSQWHNTEWEKDLMSAPPALANVLRPHGEFAIIGPGGGVDVLRAVANGSPSVTGIEINPIIATTIMRGRYADYAHHLYERPDVHIHVNDGRSFLRSSPQRFDVVQMTLVDTWASTAAGAFALSENNLYTVEAFREYFNHLKPDGMIAITRWEFREPREALRVVSVAIEALHRLGVANPARNFIVASQGDLNGDGIPVVVLAKKTAFTPAEEDAITTHLDRYPDLDALYLPSQPGKNPFSDLIASNDPQTFARTYAYNVAPVTDNAPFFFFTIKAGRVLDKGLRRGIDWKVNLGVLVLLLVLAISLLAVLIFLVLPLALSGGKSRHSPLPLLYFVAVGLGYILVEIAFIQRFVLFLGHPTYALTVVIFLLLLSSGAGSLVSRRWLARAEMGWIPLALVIVVLLAEVLFLPGRLAAWVGLGFPYRLLVSGALLVPLGFVMGMPFPTGLRALASAPTAELPRESSSADNAIEWAWAMNAAASVLGSVLAMVIAIQFGLTVTLACGAAAYLLALAVMPGLRTKAA